MKINNNNDTLKNKKNILREYIIKILNDGSIHPDATFKKPIDLDKCNYTTLYNYSRMLYSVQQYSNKLYTHFGKLPHDNKILFTYESTDENTLEDYDIDDDDKKNENEFNTDSDYDDGSCYHGKGGLFDSDDDDW
jgi:hypothetical protein